MKRIKLLICTLTVLLLCNLFTAFASENTSNPLFRVLENLANRWEETDGDDGGRAERERAAREDDEKDNQDNQDDRIGPVEEEDGGRAERERAAREADEQAEQERRRREEEMRRQQEEQLRQREESSEEQQGNGLFEHHIGDAVFYTLHDLWKYIVPKDTNPEHMWLDLESMLRDIWGEVGIVGVLESNHGYAGSDGTSFTRAVSYDYVGKNIKTNAGYDAKSYYFIVSATGERQCETHVTIYNEERPSGDWIVIKGDTFGFSPDTAALLLYVLEQTEYNPRSNIAGELDLPSNYECSSF